MTDIGSLLTDAATLMGTGMAVVFTFLTILVYLVRLMSKCLPEPSLSEPPSKSVIQDKAFVSTASPQVIAAISTAVHQYRDSKA